MFCEFAARCISSSVRYIMFLWNNVPKIVFLVPERLLLVVWSSVGLWVGLVCGSNVFTLRWVGLGWRKWTHGQRWPHTYSYRERDPHYSGPCSDVCHLGHSKKSLNWTELNWSRSRFPIAAIYGMKQSWRLFLLQVKWCTQFYRGYVPEVDNKLYIHCASAM